MDEGAELVGIKTASHQIDLPKNGIRKMGKTLGVIERDLRLNGTSLGFKAHFAPSRALGSVAEFARQTRLNTPRAIEQSDLIDVPPQTVALDSKMANRDFRAFEIEAKTAIALLDGTEITKVDRIKCVDFKPEFPVRLWFGFLFKPFDQTRKSIDGIARRGHHKQPKMLGSGLSESKRDALFLDLQLLDTRLEQIDSHHRISGFASNQQSAKSYSIWKDVADFFELDIDVLTGLQIPNRLFGRQILYLWKRKRSREGEHQNDEAEQCGPKSSQYSPNSPHRSRLSLKPNESNFQGAGDREFVRRHRCRGDDGPQRLFKRSFEPKRTRRFWRSGARTRFEGACAEHCACG